LIRYFDSSALVKRYVQEEGSSRVRRLLRTGVAVTARLSLVEMVSALARRGREGDLPASHLRRIVGEIRSDAEQLVLVELTEAVAERARELLLVRALRASDAVQLASCLLLREEAGADVALITYDDPLAAAAKAEGVPVE
jgi:predicted nucleic acid-binding protein